MIKLSFVVNVLKKRNNKINNVLLGRFVVSVINNSVQDTEGPLENSELSLLNTLNEVNTPPILKLKLL